MQLINKKKTKEGKKVNIDVSKKINLFPIFVISLVSVVIYTIYILSINKIQLGSTRDIETNGIATFFQILSSSSLIIWLYELAYSLLNNKRITVWGVISVIIFNIPGFIISGRDALIICLLSTFIVFFYCGIYAKKVLKKESKVFKITLIVFGIAIVIVLIYLIFLSNNRYGTNNDSVINMFSWSASAQFPGYLKWINNYMGGFGKLVLNIIFYYSSQLSKFALVFEEYDGPYLFGLYQLHYVSRLLPESWNLSHTVVSTALQELTVNIGIPGIKVFWETAIGYSLYDFGRIGTLFVSLIGGLIVGQLMIYANKKESILNILNRTLICVAMFITIQFSPLFDYYFIFPLAWLVILNIFDKQKNKGN